MPRILAVLTALLLLVAACSSSDDDVAGESPPDAADADDPAEDPAEPAADDATAADDADADDATAADADDDAGGTSVDDEAPSDAVSPSEGPADESLEPVRIGMMNQENDPVGSFPEAREAAEGAVDYINAELGGIDGHPVELVVCAQASPEEAQACAQELSADDLVSVVNMVNIWTLTFDFYGTMGDTPVIGGLPLFDTDYNAANARYFNGGSISVYAAMARFTVEELGVTKVAVLENSNPAANAATELGLLPIYEDMGVEVVRIVVPQPATDVAPQVSEAADVGADAVLVLTSAFECPLIATAAAQFGIPAETMIYSATCTDDTVLDQVGDEMVGAFVARGGYTEDDPWAPEEVQNRIAQTFDLLDTYAPDVPLGGLGPLGFVTMLDIELLYDEIGFDNLDGDTILATMDDGSQRGVLGSFGWACVYADIDLTSVCSGDNLFVQLLPDFTTEPPLSDGFVNGLQLLGG